MSLDYSGPARPAARRARDPAVPRNKQRVDLLLVERGLAPSRSQAQALVMAGRVFVGEQRIDKAGQVLATDAALEVRGTERYVSRGGTKLEGALDGFALDVEGLVALDVGASTGGFTDCLLQRGASKIYAVDVGTGLLADKLRRDPRVVVMEGVNARHLRRDAFADTVDLVVVDASFIGIDKLVPAIAAILAPGARLLAMIKPQFEAGRAEVKRGKGVIRDPAVRDAAIAQARAAIVAEGFRVIDEQDSKLAGPKGNVERFVLAARL